jgi:hypothetical protein
MKSDHDSDSEPDDADLDRGRLDRIVPEIVKRILEAGIEKISEGPENVRKVVGELKLPKEALHAVLSQLDEGKSGLYRVVAREVRDFLERTNFADELTRALTALSFEIRTEVRFVPNSAGDRATPDIRSNVRVKRRDEKKDAPKASPSSPPPAPAETEEPGEEKE